MKPGAAFAGLRLRVALRSAVTPLVDRLLAPADGVRVVRAPQLAGQAR